MIEIVSISLGAAAFALVRWLGRKSKPAPTPPESVQRLLVQIAVAEFGGMNYNETGVSTCWLKLPADRRLSAGWYRGGSRSQLQLKRSEGDWVDLPQDQWSTLIIKAVIEKTKAEYDRLVREAME